MTPHFPETGHVIRIETHQHYIREPDGINPRPDQLVQKLVILFKYGQDLPLHMTARTCQMIMMPVLAVFTAELLVRPAVSYLVSALQTARDMSFLFLRVIH